MTTKYEIVHNSYRICTKFQSIKICNEVNFKFRKNSKFTKSRQCSNNVGQEAWTEAWM